jgi:hypothetical protein
MTDKHENKDVIKIVEAFHLMWDQFPQVVLLLRKSREIVAANKEAEKFGFHPGLKCYQVVGQNEIHAGCKANLALQDNTAQRSIIFNKEKNRVSDAYWLPVSPENDLYLHFTVYIKLPIDEKL